MLKPFYNKKKNIDDRLVPAVSPDDAGKVLGVTEDGKIAAIEAGGGGDVYANVISLTTSGIAAWKFIIYTSTPLTVGAMSTSDFSTLLTSLGASSSKHFPINAVSFKFTGTLLEQNVLTEIEPSGATPWLYGYTLTMNSSGPTITHNNFEGAIYPSAISVVSSEKI